MSAANLSVAGFPEAVRMSADACSARFQVTTRDADPGAHGGEPDRRGLADSAGGAGDQHDVATRPEVRHTLITTFPRACPVAT